MRQLEVIVEAQNSHDSLSPPKRCSKTGIDVCQTTSCSEVLVAMHCRYSSAAPYALYKRGRDVCLEWPTMSHCYGARSRKFPSGEYVTA